MALDTAALYRTNMEEYRKFAGLVLIFLPLERQEAKLSPFRSGTTT